MTSPMDTHEGLALSTEDVLREAREAKRWHDENFKPYTAGVIADCIATIERLAGDAQAPREPALHKAVRGLCIEIEGIWGAFEYGLRAEISNTNYVLIRDKIEEARTALTVSSTNRWPQDAIDQEMIERTSDDWVLPSPHGGTDA